MNQIEKSKLVRRWMAENQGKHPCQCGCGQAIVIKIHHHTRGIPSFINWHVTRITNPMSGRIGNLNPHFKNGRYVNQDGYVLILVPGPGRSKYVLEHRLNMAKHLGRPIGDDEVVHHKNGDKKDNRLCNLELMSNADHSSYHALAGDTGFRLSKVR